MRAHIEIEGGRGAQRAPAACTGEDVWIWPETRYIQTYQSTLRRYTICRSVPLIVHVMPLSRVLPSSLEFIFSLVSRRLCIHVCDTVRTSVAGKRDARDTRSRSVRRKIFYSRVRILDLYELSGVGFQFLYSLAPGLFTLCQE